VSFTLKNTGSRDGAEVAEVYATLPSSTGEPPKRLVGWSKVWLKAGESKDVKVNMEGKYLSIWDEAGVWKLVPGEYVILVGGSSAELPLTQRIGLE
jgi:beta-glucosidase